MGLYMEQLCFAYYDKERERTPSVVTNWRDASLPVACKQLTLIALSFIFVTQWNLEYNFSYR